MEPQPERTVLIAGAAGALATSVARRFAAAGWRLALLARERHGPALRALHPEALVLGCELADEEAVGAAARDVVATVGAPHAVLNLAGGFATGSAAALRAADLERMLDANLRPAVHVTGALLPAMLERGSGFVLGVAAAQALRGGGRAAAYAAAKGAVLGYFRGLRSELGPRGIDVSVIIPMGTIDTAENRAAMPTVDPGTWIDPEAIARSILFLAGQERRGRVAELAVEAG